LKRGSVLSGRDSRRVAKGVITTLPRLGRPRGAPAEGVIVILSAGIRDDDSWTMILQKGVGGAVSAGTP